MALNYRLGAFRWSGGLSLQSDSTANASLLDQRFALEWVQQNIKSFGGDRKEVTLTGESSRAFTFVQEARALSSEELRVANYVQVSSSQWDSFTYALVVDGTYVPNQPIRLLLDGNFHKDVHIMQGHNSDEGLIFNPSYAQTTSGYDTFVSTLLNSTDIEQVTQNLYPPIFDGSYGYENNIQRPP
ncbi:hypothetical protein ABVK25_004264 [Lepraria finkii]|uniref:Carboxylesterase type B domain-containing protein n=1 Tax=Lepraria finkii TaxID=1340010 RepID=A0ABR4BF29_9LECA